MRRCRFGLHALRLPFALLFLLRGRGNKEVFLFPLVGVEAFGDLLCMNVDGMMAKVFFLFLSVSSLSSFSNDLF